MIAMPKSSAKTQKLNSTHTKSTHKQPTPFFSIIIPTLNEEKYLPLLLQDLVDQTYQDFEIIVVDGKSNDQTTAEAKNFSKSLNISIHISPQTGVANQRNLGIKHSKGKWILFMDADNRLPIYFLDGIRYQIAKNPKVDVFTCFISPDSSSPPAQVISRSINSLILFNELRGSAFALGAMIGVKNSLAKNRNFDTSMSINEDMEFVRKIIDDGYNFQVFRDPTYVYSLRRLRKEGVLKMVAIESKLLLNNLSGGNNNSNFGYVMMGGDYYTVEDSQSRTHRLKKLTKTQLNKLTNYVQNTFNRYF